jgi:hypothetical protein
LFRIVDAFALGVKTSDIFLRYLLHAGRVMRRASLASLDGKAAGGFILRLPSAASNFFLRKRFYTNLIYLRKKQDIYVCEFRPDPSEHWFISKMQLVRIDGQMNKKWKSHE